MEAYELHFYRGVSNGLRQELFHFPDPTPQIAAVRSSLTSHPFGWFEVNEFDEVDVDELTDEKLLDEIKQKVDPATMFVLKSVVASDGIMGPFYSTFHMIFPFIIGPRNRAKNGLTQLIDKTS